MIGIYMITVKDVYAYIGQSINVEERLKKHKRDIENKCHPNMGILGDYSLSDCNFSVLLECSKDELNSKEAEMYNKYSTTFIMLNKRECGLQGVNGERLVFHEDRIPSLEYVDGNFYIDGIIVRKDEDKFCLSDLIIFIKNNSDYDFRPSKVLTTHDFIERVNCLYHINIPKNRNTSKYLKKHGLYKVVGARDNKKIYCDFGVFVTFAFCSCPQLAASICIAIGNNILGNKEISISENRKEDDK